MADAPDRFSLKDHLFNQETMTRLGGLLAPVIPGFATDQFVAEVMAGMKPLELKQRITHVAGMVDRYLPEDYEQSIELIVAALPPPLDPSLSDGDFGDFIFAPFGEIIVAKGLDPGYYDLSMAAIKQVTQRFSMEWPIRPFIDAYPDRTLSVLREWASDENYHVRRLVSEGTRPLLPWAPRIRLGPSDTEPLLDLLHADPTRYVTRSVANHLNDIAKIDPGLVVDILSRWRGRGLQDERELDWMTRHALRTLIKRGDPAALELLGFSADPAVSVGPITVVPAGPVRIGETIRFEFDIAAHGEEKLVVDYIIDFLKKDGAHRPKVFKLKSLEMATGEARTLSKTHRMPASATTFTLYPGIHRLTVQVNGRPAIATEFELLA
jgi:3-methyladenine DNA glycosylase AlkC